MLTLLNISISAAEDIKLFSSCNYSFLTEDEGLPNGFVDDIIMDSRGFVWVATHGGIARYDGYDFLIYTDTSNEIRLKSKFVNKLCEDNFGRLWIGSESGIDIVNLNSCNMVDIRQSVGSLPESLSSSPIYTMYMDSSGRLWISAEKALFCISFDKEGKISKEHSLDNEELSHVYSIIDWEGTVCAGMGNNIYKLETNEGNGITAELLSDAIKPFTEDWTILTMAAESENLLWIGTNRGLFRYNKQTSKTDRYRYSNHRPGMLSQAYITDIKFTHAGKLIAATMNGLNVYHPENDTFEYVRHDNNAPTKSINCNMINCLMTSGEDIWVGTETGGINLLTPKRILSEVMPLPVNGICEDKSGNIWLGIVEGGLNRMNDDSGTMTTYKFNQKDPNSISNNMLTGLIVDSQNHLWAYTWGVGINELDLSGGNRFNPGEQTHGSPQHIAGKFIRHLREDSLGLESDFLSSACEDIVSGDLWFATTRGLHFYRKSDNRFTRVLFPDFDNVFETVGTISIDDKRRLWMPTSEGLFILDINSYDTASGRFNHTWLKTLSPAENGSNDNSAPRTKMSSCLCSSNGTIWLGSNGNGLYRLTADNNNQLSFANFTMADGLPDNSIVGMVEDGNHKIWISTGYGLSCVDPERMEFTNYTTDDGLPSNQFYRNSLAWSSSRNKLFAGTMNGMAIFTPPSTVHKDKGGKVYVSTLRVAGKQIMPAVGDTPNPYIFHERQENIVVNFTTLNYGRQNRVRYAYRFDKGVWTETKPGEHAAAFTSLPSGKHTLQIRSTDENGHWNDEITDFPIRVEPYFFKTAPFIVCLTVIIVLSIYFIIRYKNKRREKPISSVNIMETGGETGQEEATTTPEEKPGVIVDESKIPSRDEELLNSAYTVMAQNYANTEYGVDNFVRDIGYSKTWINQRLQAISNCSIGQFMKSYRLNAAREIIESDTKNATIADIATAVGFSDPKYFTRCFKEQFGILPSELQKKSRGGSLR